MRTRATSRRIAISNLFTASRCRFASANTSPQVSRTSGLLGASVPALLISSSARSTFDAEIATKQEAKLFNATKLSGSLATAISQYLSASMKLALAKWPSPKISSEGTSMIPSATWFLRTPNSFVVGLILNTSNFAISPDTFGLVASVSAIVSNRSRLASNVPSVFDLIDFK